MKNPAPSYGQCYLGFALGLAPFMLLLAISALFGANTVTANGKYVHGVGAVVVAVVLNLLFPAILAGVQKLGFIFWNLLPQNRAAADA